MYEVASDSYGNPCRFISLSYQELGGGFWYLTFQI